MNIPFCAYCVQISTTFFESATDALVDAFQLDVGFDELDRAIGARGHGLHGRAGEPVDHRAAGNQSEQERRDAESRSLPVVLAQAVGQATMIEKIIVVAPTTAVPISTGLAVALNVLPAPSFSSRMFLGIFEVRRRSRSSS